MKHIIIVFIFFTTSLVLNAGLYDNLSTSDTVTSSQIAKPKCPLPIKQTSFNSQKEVNNYNDKINAYKICLNTFIQAHNTSNEQDQEAIKHAIKEWNTFISGHEYKDKSLGISIKKGPASTGHFHDVGYEDQTKITKDFSF